MTELIDKTCIIQGFMPSKQITSAHVVASPGPHLYPKIGLSAGNSGAIGVLTITPGEAAIITTNIATKSAGVELAFVDRFSGSLLIAGRLADVGSSTTGIVTTLQATLGFTPAPLTRI